MKRWPTTKTWPIASATGWLRVDPEGVGTEDELEPWVARGMDYARSLPDKAKD